MGKFVTDSGNEWTVPLLEEAYKHIEEIGVGEYGLDIYKNQFDIISSEGMIEAYVTNGLPTSYNHWSFGKKYMHEKSKYKRGHGLAYEIVINSDPCINYLMEENTLATQIMVMAHSSIGHNSFFKNNELFKQWTLADFIVDYMNFAKHYISQCEQKYGFDKVERILDAAHALQHYSVDKYQKPKKKKGEDERKRIARLNFDEKTFDQYSTNWDKTEKTGNDIGETSSIEPTENLLYFLEKNAPELKVWERELLRIVRTIGQYYWPQMQCVAGNHLVSSDKGLLRFDELIQNDGYNSTNSINMLTEGDKFTSASHTYLNRKQKVLKIKTQTGKIIVGTYEHPLKVLDGNIHNLKRLDKLTLDDYLVIHTEYNNIFSKNEPKFNLNYINDNMMNCKLCDLESHNIASHIVQFHKITNNEYKDQFFVNDTTSDFYKISRSKNIINPPDQMTPDFAELVAYLSYCSITPIDQVASTFRFVDQQKAPRFVELLKYIGIETSVDDRNIGIVNFNSFTLREFIKNNIPEILDRNMVIPKIIRMSTKDSVLAYIRGIFDTRATCRKNVSEFNLCGYGDEIETFNHLQTILASVGIISRLSFSKKLSKKALCEALGIEFDEIDFTRSYQIITLKIDQDYKNDFQEKIGSSIIKTKYINTDYPGNSIIPGANKIIDLIRNKVKLEREEYLNKYNLSSLSYKIELDNNLLSNKQNFTRLEDIYEVRSNELYASHIKKYSNKFNNLFKLDYPEVKKLIDLIEISKDVYYDKIVSIEELDELQDVYDVTIPENHLFWMDGFISHNTQVSNEGLATFVHHKIMNRLYDKGILDEACMMEFCVMHAGVINQPPMMPLVNPYKLGWSIYCDIERICTEPTKEDEEWFPHLVGTDPWTAVKSAMTDYKDVSFIEQFVSPKLIRDFRLMSLHDKGESSDSYTVSNINDEYGYRNIRKLMADQRDINLLIPRIEVVEVQNKNDRRLVLKHHMVGKTQIDKTSAMKTLKLVHRLWQFPVSLESYMKNDDGTETHVSSMVYKPTN